MIVLLPHVGFLSETSRMIAIYEALRARGVDACVATHGGTWESTLGASGVAYDLLEPRMSAARCAEFLRQIPGVAARPGPSFTADELRAFARSEAAYLRARGARAVVTGFTLSALLSSRLAGVPLVTEHAGSFVPPMAERGLFPAPTRGPFPLAGLLPKRAQRWLANQGPVRARGFTEVIDGVARELGVEGVPTLAAMLMGDLTLVTDVPEVTGVSREALESWRPKTPRHYRADPVLRYVGPLFARLAVPIPDEVERFLRAPGPVVYVAMTSSLGSLVEDVVRRVEASGARVLVAATAHRLDHLRSSRVCVAGVLPSHEVFPRVAAGVVTGGQGSVQTALAAGRPFVGIPLQPEQEWNVAAVERLGAAVRVSEASARGPAMTAAVRALLDDASARAAAARIAAVFADIDGPGRCAEAILEYLDRRERRAS
ncbi:MAG: hypothetical protein U0326_18455 [Polyangiales bacterium]